MPPSPKVVILLKIKGATCKCGRKDSTEDVSPRSTEKIQTEPLPPAAPTIELAPSEQKAKVKPKQSEQGDGFGEFGEKDLQIEPQIVATKPTVDYLAKSPKNTRYAVKITPAGQPTVKAAKSEKKKKSCLKSVCCKKRKKSKPEPEPPPADPIPVKPNQLEFNFSKDGNVAEPETAAGDIKSSPPKNLNFIPNKLYNLGERGSGIKLKHGMQDFYELRKQYLNQGTLFEDPEFPPKESSLVGAGQNEDAKEVATRGVWKRPGKIAKDPRLFVDGYSRFDVQQGMMGDCWLLAALAGITIFPRLFSQIVPDDQSFTKDYAGIFHFRFWQCGRWVDVVVDDNIPLYNNKLAFLRSSESNEFWPCLLEKAYAKLHGCYENLDGGSTTEAMTDLTGGICESFINNEPPENYFTILLKAYERGSIMATYIIPDPKVKESVTPEGLVMGHAFSITKLTQITLKNGQKVNMIRIRNPWGNETEWNGPWSDGSNEWHSVSANERDRIGLVFENDGEFWMNFDDFVSRFYETQVCNLNPSSVLYTSANERRWEMTMYESEWVRGVTAGGCINYPATFSSNPQYRVILRDVDDDSKKGTCTLVVGLMQKRRRQLRSQGMDWLAIGVQIYRLEYPNEAPVPLTKNYINNYLKETYNGRYRFFSESVYRFNLKPGTYVIIPTTYYPNEEGEFLLRIFTEKKNVMAEHDNVGIIFSSPPKAKKDIEESDEVYKLFVKTAGEDGEIDYEELKTVLNNTLQKETKGRGFSNDVCRSMIAMMDEDFSGKLNFDEFKKLWSYVLYWKEVFYEFDKDSSGTFSGFELREAMENAGFRLNHRILNRLMQKYGNKKGEMNFEDFIMCAIKLKTLIDFFGYKAEKDAITFSMEEWLEYTVGAT